MVRCKARKGGLRWAGMLAIFGGLGLGVGCAQERANESVADSSPGYPGGLCLAPDGVCRQGECNRQRNYCFDPGQPCAGFTCGPDERGWCTVTEQDRPTCQCESGYSNADYELYCCPDPSNEVIDPLCARDGERDGRG